MTTPWTPKAVSVGATNVYPEGEDKLLIARAEDTLRLAEKHFCIKTLGFLNPHQRMVLTHHLLPPPGMKLDFDGGHPEAERTLFLCYPDFYEPNPETYLCLLECTGRDLHNLSHRDYLGSLMGLGIVRENIGDILVSEEKSFIFLKPDLLEYVMQNLTKVGRTGILLRHCPISDAELPLPSGKEIQGTVASLRLDSVLSVGAGISRSKAAELIHGGLVTVNWETIQEVSADVKENDVLSARGYGRMKLSRVGGLTRKKRYGITVIRYI